MENLKDTLGENYADFKMLYDNHLNEINSNITKIKEKSFADK